jgi:flavin prenyltransferase
MDPHPIIVGISGASGALYGIRLLQALRDAGVETHLIVTPAAEHTIALETDWSLEAVRGLAAHNHDVGEIGAAPASGSWQTRGMVIAPCSIKSAALIANSIAENLLIRAADVTLKEGRRLVLLVRETPLHVGHLRMLEQLALMGATVFPPVPAFYNRPRTLDDIVAHTVGRVLTMFGIENDLAVSWRGEAEVVDS